MKVCFKGNHHPCWVCVNHRRHHSKKHFRHTKKPNTQKKLSSNFKHTVTLSHSLSLSVSPSHSQSSSLSLSHSHSEPIASSPAPSPAAPVAVAASRFRRSISASLSLSPSVVGELPHKSKDSLFFLLCLWGTDAVGMGVRDKGSDGFAYKETEFKGLGF